MTENSSEIYTIRYMPAKFNASALEMFGLSPSLGRWKNRGRNHKSNSKQIWPGGKPTSLWDVTLAREPSAADIKRMRQAGLELCDPSSEHRYIKLVSAHFHLNPKRSLIVEATPIQMMNLSNWRRVESIFVHPSYAFMQRISNPQTAHG